MLETPHVLAILVGYAYGLCLVVFRISESVPRWWRVGATNSSYLNPPLVHSSAIFLSDYTYIICLLLSTSYARMVIYYLLHAAHMVLDFTYGMSITSLKERLCRQFFNSSKHLIQRSAFLRGSGSLLPSTCLPKSG